MLSPRLLPALVLIALPFAALAQPAGAYHACHQDEPNCGWCYGTQLPDGTCLPGIPDPSCWRQPGCHGPSSAPTSANIPNCRNVYDFGDESLTVCWRVAARCAVEIRRTTFIGDETTCLP